MVKNSFANARHTHRRLGFNPWIRKIPWRRKWQPTPVFLPGKPHEQRSLVGYSPWSCKRVRQDLVTRQQQLYNRKGPEKRERGWSESEKYP